MSDRKALAEKLGRRLIIEPASRNLSVRFSRGEWQIILAALRTDTDPSLERVEAMREACLSVVDNIRTNYSPSLNKSRYRADEIRQFFSGACSLIDEDIRALPVTNEGAER